MTEIIVRFLGKLLEVGYEALIDAGVIPTSLQGSNIGVFVAFTNSDAFSITKRSKQRTNLYGALGNESSMLANRLSYTFGFTGPSLGINTSCSSSSTAIHEALLSIRMGLCDAAIVAGAHCNFDHVVPYMFHELELTSVDGKCKAFDAAADGYARAEAAVAIYISKLRDSKRAYATLVHTAINNDGYKKEGITFPSGVQQENVIRKVYEESGVDPLEVDYVEAHGTGTKVGDPQEIHAIFRALCERRNGSLLVGSVKTNMGHSEPIAGLCALSKMILSHINGILPANLHYNNPSPDIPALLDGSIQVVNKNLKFKAKYVGINSTGFGGTNVHILLKFDSQEEIAKSWKPNIPLILLCSGRTEQAVQHFLDKALIKCQDQHFVRLLHELSKDTIPRHPYRGFVVINSENIETHVDKAEAKEFVWFIFTGLGSQWVGMINDLIKFDVFNRSIIKEHSAETIRCFLAIDKIELNFESPTTCLQDQLKKDLVYNVYKKGRWGFVGHHTIPFEEIQTKQDLSHAYGCILKPGEYSSLNWIASPISLINKNLVEIQYSSLNFEDIGIGSIRSNEASNLVPFQNNYKSRCEFSGKYKGNRVFGFGTSQTLATHLDPENLVLFDIPKHWTYEAAATVPLVYCTVYLALIFRGRMKSGETILVHTGVEDVCQAAIAVALSMKCKVFITVSIPKKQAFLKTRFPSLNDANFTNLGNSNQFKTHILNHTNGRGVDLVFNSQADERIKTSIDCLTDNGRFLQIGTFAAFNNTNIGLSVLLKGVSIFAISLKKFIENSSHDEMSALKKYINDGIELGIVRPLNFHVFKSNQLEQACRFMARANHVGKVLIQVREDEHVPALIPAYPSTYFDLNKSYIIVGGLGDMGFELANWMVSRGAKKLVLVSRTGVKSTYHEYRITIWENQGVLAAIYMHDLTTITGARDLWEEATKLGPIGGVFNTAVVLRDALFENQTPASFIDSANCKATATLNLDIVSRTLAPELDYFVVFSSTTAFRGFPGQTNYGYSNSAMERICEQRHSDGLPALAVQWGPVGDVGALHRQIGDSDNFEGYMPQRLESCLETLDLLLQQRRPVVSSFLVFKEDKLKETKAKDSLVDTIARILGFKNVSKVNPKSTLVELGMDSIMSTEVT
ncbi:unnamed protein product, partial [Allacma fusca]